MAEITVTRDGTYGSLQQDWTAGFPLSSRPSGFVRGTLSPDGGTTVLGNAVQSATIEVLVRSLEECHILDLKMSEELKCLKSSN